ncbi:MAG: N-acetyl-gamma-glutamyl-phosphate reductase [Eggerthellaceae bacterium]|jgi:N-acetyl-gamma-glutamyl-phosphate reductase|nr:N-acetyl-gamma-glutamyl-phosphate reductase [Eggerthellaceae bacterium]MDR2721460.1 N-acetyl-gamma-glutamyl-phosphate reductase [Coriobacteriaceae bacterium]
MVKVGIIGAAGFTGAELMRLIQSHPAFELHVATSDSQVGKTIASTNPTFIGLGEMCFSAHDDARLFECDAVFLAVPHTVSLDFTPSLLSKGISVFDLSADYRLQNAEVYEQWYGKAHTSVDLLASAVFGLPELKRAELLGAQARFAEGEAVLVACAGCYPTASSLAAYPALAAGMVAPPIIIDAISGITGAGKAASERTHFCFANENLEAYNIGAHRHTPEIEQILGLEGKLVFSPHLAPLNRGLLATVYLPLAQSAKTFGGLDGITECYRDFYRDALFVEVLAAKILPRTASVVKSNRAHIGLALQESTNTLVAVAAIDNLCKGASGQAIQCANIVFGFAEDAGLEAPACYV